MKRYNPLFKKQWITIKGGLSSWLKLDEITLDDLRGDAGISDFTKRFKKERNKIMGSETRTSKLIECNIIDNKHVDFVFLSESTEKYPPDFQRKTASRQDNYKLKLEPSKTYTITIRILNVKDWIETYPEKEVITMKDIKDILDVSEILIDSDVPSFYFQGGCYYLQQLGGTIYKGKIKKPKFWNKSQYHGEANNFLDKISQSIINQISFFRNIMASMLTKKARETGWV